MKTALKIIFAPVIAIMWLAIKVGIGITYISGIALGIISGVFALIGVIYFFIGSSVNGIIGLVIAYIISPYGIPMLTIMMLGVVDRLRAHLKYVIYR